jgi:hypothetical protein
MRKPGFLARLKCFLFGHTPLDWDDKNWHCIYIYRAPVTTTPGSAPIRREGQHWSYGVCTVCGELVCDWSKSC